MPAAHRARASDCSVGLSLASTSPRARSSSLHHCEQSVRPQQRHEHRTAQPYETALLFSSVRLNGLGSEIAQPTCLARLPLQAVGSSTPPQLPRAAGPPSLPSKPQSPTLPESRLLMQLCQSQPPSSPKLLTHQGTTSAWTAQREAGRSTEVPEQL